MESIKVHLGHKQIWVDARTFRAWFPRIRAELWIQGDVLVQRLDDHFSGRFGIKKYWIEKTLEHLFGILRPQAQHGDGGTRQRVCDRLTDQLEVECINNPWESRGLQQTRHTFIVLVCVALDFESTLLAEALLRFWATAAKRIRQCEKFEYVPDWKTAAAKLQQVEDAALNPCRAVLMPYVEWPRGRPLRNLAVPCPGHRARSAPVVQHRRNAEIRLVAPPYPSSAWPLPMISPAGYPRDEYFDELNSIQHQQREINDKLDNVDGKLNYLIHCPF